MQDKLWTAWLAGFMDGEGCIRIDSRSTTADGRLKTASPRLSVASTDHSVLEEIRQREGGRLYEIKRYGRNHKLGYEWRLYSPPEIQALFQRLRPYLRVKALEAWLILEFLASRTLNPPRIPVSPEEVALREGFRLALANAKTM